MEVRRNCGALDLVIKTGSHPIKCNPFWEACSGAVLTRRGSRRLEVPVYSGHGTNVFFAWHDINVVCIYGTSCCLMTPGLKLLVAALLQFDGLLSDFRNSWLFLEDQQNYLFVIPFKYSLKR